MKQDGYISFQNMYLDFLATPTAKVATLWFDELFFGDPNAKKTEFFIEFVEQNEQLSNKARTELEKIWHPVELIYPEFKLDISANDLWRDAPQKLVEITKTILPHTQDAAGYENYKLGAYTMNEILCWQARPEGVAFVGLEFEEKIVRNLVEAAEVKVSAQELILNDFPDFGSISWDNVIELRNSPYLQAFREKVDELLTYSSDANLTSRLFDEYENSLRFLARQMEPSVGKAIFKALASNIPFLPVNPASIYYGGDDVVKASNIKRDLAWVFMMLEWERLANATDGH